MSDKLLKPFDRKEVMEIIRIRNWHELKEYNLRGADLQGANFVNADLSHMDLTKANLTGCILYKADLLEANLTEACLRYADLSEAFLVKACFRGADLRDTDLREAVMKETNLILANLRRANLWYSDLKFADLNIADLRSADLRNAILYGTNLRGADLCLANLQRACLVFTRLFGADLRGTYLYEASLSHTKLEDIITDEETKFFAMQCPETGAFVGYKKAFGCEGEPYIVELRIPEHALRSSATTEKCRCSEAVVVSITTLDGAEGQIKSAWSKYDSNFIYKVGETVKVDDFNMDRWTKCAQGIHFFMDREKAVEYVA